VFEPGRYRTVVVAFVSLPLIDNLPGCRTVCKGESSSWIGGDWLSLSRALHGENGSHPASPVMSAKSSQRKTTKATSAIDSPSTSGQTSANTVAGTSGLLASEVVSGRGGSRRRHWLWRGGVLFAVVAGIALSRSIWVPTATIWFTQRALAAWDARAALEWLDRGRAWAPETPQQLLLRARTERRLGQLDQVAVTLAAAAKRGADPALVQREGVLAMAQSGQLSTARPYLPRLLAAAGDDLPDICEAYVIGFLRTSQYGEALQLLGAWIADWPDDPYPLLLRSRVWMTESQTKRAQADLEQAFNLAPQDPEVAYELARSHQLQNRWKEALALLPTCLEHPEWKSRAESAIGLSYKALGDLTAAELHLKSAVDAEPENVEALREFGRLMQENGRAADAAAVLERAVQLAPYDDELHYLLAQALQTLGQAEEAAPHFNYVQTAREKLRRLRLIRDLLHKDPANVELLVEAGEILLNYSDPEEGVVRLLAVIDRQPTHQRCRQLLVEHYERRAKTEPRFAALAEEHRRWIKPRPPTDSVQPAMNPPASDQSTPSNGPTSLRFPRYAEYNHC
jgi:tetratricopeptide (TPR) repeat protein